MTDEFMKLENGEGTFSGIRMYKKNGSIFFKVDDLIAKSVLPKEAKNLD